MFAVQVDRVVEAWRKLLERVSAPARLVKRAEEERSREREKEEEMRRKVQEEKKPVCSECDEGSIYSNNRDQHHHVILASTVSSEPGKALEKTSSGKKQISVDQPGAWVGPSTSEVETTPVTTTEVDLFRQAIENCVYKCIHQNQRYKLSTAIIIIIFFMVIVLMITR